MASHNQEKGEGTTRRASTDGTTTPVSAVVVPTTPRVLLLNSTVVSGFAGAKSCAFPMQALGLDVDPLYTTQHSNHSGYPRVVKVDLTRQQISDYFYKGLRANNLLQGRYGYLFTGFVSDADTLRDVVRMYRDLKAANPGLKWFCDTVVGDRDKSGREIYYCPKELVPLYRDVAVRHADVVTPNQLELELLSGYGRIIRTRHDATTALKELHKYGRDDMIIVLTSVCYEDNTSEMLVSQRKRAGSCAAANADASNPDDDFDIDVYSAPFEELPYHFTGTGDCMMGLLIGNMHRYPNDVRTACSKSLSTMQAIMNNSIQAIRKQEEEEQQQQAKTVNDATSTESTTSSGNRVINRSIELKIIQSLKDILDPPDTNPIEQVM